MLGLFDDTVLTICGQLQGIELEFGLFWNLGFEVS